MNDFHISLEARNPEKGHMRAYSIDAAQDLFGHWIVAIHFGRIGRPGRSVIYSAPDKPGARRIIRQCLSRRSTAPRRIGVPYQIREYTDPHRFKAFWYSPTVPAFSPDRQALFFGVHMNTDYVSARAFRKAPSMGLGHGITVFQKGLELLQ